MHRKRLKAEMNFPFSFRKIKYRVSSFVLQSVLSTFPFSIRLPPEPNLIVTAIDWKTEKVINN